jgi:hypothetical protein
LPFSGDDGLNSLIALAQQFTPQGQVLEVREYGCGNVNDTYLVTLAGSAEARFILQRLNTEVFRQPELVMGNLTTVTGHVQQRLAHEPLGPGRRFELPRVLPARDGRDHLLDQQGSFWRALSFIHGAETFDIIKDEQHAREVGSALGLFHYLLADLPPHRLADTLPGFHLMPAYLKYYDEILGPNGRPPQPKWIFASGSSKGAGPGLRFWKTPESRGSSRCAPSTAIPR